MSNCPKIWHLTIYSRKRKKWKQPPPFFWSPFLLKYEGYPIYVSEKSHISYMIYCSPVFFVRVLTEKSLDMSSHKIHGVFILWKRRLWRRRRVCSSSSKKEEEWYIGSTWTICVHMSLCLHSDIGINHSKWWLSPYHSNMHGSSNSGHYRLPPRTQHTSTYVCVMRE